MARVYASLCKSFITNATIGHETDKSSATIPRLNVRNDGPFRVPSVKIARSTRLASTGMAAISYLCACALVRTYISPSLHKSQPVSRAYTTFAYVTRACVPCFQGCMKNGQLYIRFSAIYQLNLYKFRIMWTYM